MEGSMVSTCVGGRAIDKEIKKARSVLKGHLYT